MKAGWQERKLSDLCDVFADGDWVESKDQSSDGIRLIQTGNVGEGVFKDRGEKARYISEATFKRLRCMEIVEGDCLISRLPDPVGRSCIVPATGKRMITAVDCTIVRFKPNELLPEFFNFYSQSGQYVSEVAKLCTGTTRNRISRSNLSLTAIPVPPLQEQKRIVAILDEAFAGIATTRANAEKNLQSARGIFESHLFAVLTEREDRWTEKPLEELVDAECSLSYGIVQPGEDVPNGLVIVRPTDLTTKVIEKAGLKRINPLLAKSYGRTTLRGGELLLCVRGSTGVVSVASSELAGGNVTRGIVPIRFNRSLVTQEMGYYLMRGEPIQRQIREKTYGAALMQINIGDLRKIRVPVPPLLRQAALASTLDRLSDETERLSIIYERKLTALDGLRRSLLHRAFAGELRANKTTKMIEAVA